MIYDSTIACGEIVKLKSLRITATQKQKCYVKYSGPKRTSDTLIITLFVYGLHKGISYAATRNEQQVMCISAIS